MHTTLDTSANPYTEKRAFLFQMAGKLMKYTDLVLLDIKQIDEEEHVKLTGCTNTNIPCHGRKAFGDEQACMDPPCACAGRK